MNENASPRVEAFRRAALVTLLLTPIWLFVTALQMKNALQERREQIRGGLQLRVDSLERRMQRLQKELAEIGNFARRRDSASLESFAEGFAEMSAGLRADSDWVYAYEIVDDGVIRYCCPVEGNEAFIGFNLYSHISPQFTQDLQSVTEQQEVRLTGPVSLVQGGVGIVLRGSCATPNYPHRIAAIVMKLEQLLAEAGINLADPSSQIAIRHAGELPFFGSPDVFDARPELIKSRCVNQIWEFAAVPVNGWHPNYYATALFFGGNGLAILAIAGMLTYVVSLRQQLLTDSLSRRTRELSSAQTRLEREMEMLSSTEAQLRFSETRFRAVFERAAIGVTMVDSATMRFVLANERAAEMFGYSVSELSELTPAQMIHPDDLAGYSEHLNMLLKGDIQEYSVEHRCVDANGSSIWVLQVVSAIRDGHESGPMLVALFEDIQRRKSVEERLRNLADSLPGLLWYVDRSLVIQSVNKMGATWHAKGLGPAIDDMLGHHLEQVLSQEQYRYVTPWIERALSGETVEFVLSGGRDGSELRFCQVIYAPHVAEDGSVPGFFTLVMDITDRRRAELKRDDLERRLMEAQKMEAVGTLAGGIAHDFNNMLQVILGHSNMLLMQTSEQPSLAEQISAIQSAAQRSSHLIQQLLAFARRQSTAPMALDLNDAVPRMLGLMRRVVSEEIELTWIPTADLWPIFIDPSQWDQIVANLIVNSRDAIHGRGKITLTARNVPASQASTSFVEGYPSGDSVAFSISDNGCGIDEAAKVRIFEPFFTTKEPGKGTGLGLSVVYGIVSAHDGVISVTSSKGSGTTCDICFPRMTAHHEQSIPGKPVHRELTGSETILLVEDEPLVMNLFRSLLKKLGYTIIVARSATEAIELAEQNVVHLLITDVIMPDMHGRDLADAIVSRQNHTRVLFMSGFANDVVQRKSAHPSDIDFLQKPFSPGDLANRIREILAG